MKKVIIVCVFALSLIATVSYGIGGPAGGGTSGPSNPGGTPGPGYSCTVMSICRDIFSNQTGSVSCTGICYCKRGFESVTCDGNTTKC